ncbi:MAG: histidine kinase, partial [Actinomycetia bacterium]|nr:histidine kinase [Actinomycetes bacterium]
MTASLTRSWRPWLWLGISFTAAALVLMGSSSESSTLLVSAPLVLALGTLAVGLARRGGRDRARYEQALAAAAARDAVLSDRITIARELHDI